MNFAVVMDSIHQIKPKTDTSLALLLSAKSRGWTLFYMEPKHLYVENGIAMGRMYPLDVTPNHDRWFTLGEEVHQPLSAIDAICMRKDPPFDMEYIYATYILETAEQQGCFVFNKPAALRDCNEKFFATRFSQCMAPTIVTKDIQLITTFMEKHDHVILKPMDWMAGTAIFHLKRSDPNHVMLLETFVDLPQRTVMVQKFIPEIATKGDKRIFIIDGEPLEQIFTRIPKEPGLPANNARGGSSVAVTLSDRDRWICAQVGPILKQKGLLFSAIDVIGDFLTEINVTSPTGVRFIQQQYNVDVCKNILDIVAKRTTDR